MINKIDPNQYVKHYFTHITELLSRISINEIVDVIKVLLDARQRGATTFFIGNGGSAATASHFVCDLAFGTRNWDTPFRAISLSDNNAVMTALGNDYHYEEVFVLQLKNLMKKDDVVVAISASGNSPNIVKGIEFANEKGATSVGLSGFTGGKLKEISKYPLHVPSSVGEYGPVEDLHMIFDHVICNYLRDVCNEI